MSDINDFDFSKLDLSKYEVDEGVRRLRAGRYICEIKSAKIERMKSGKGQSLVLELEDPHHGNIVTYVTVRHSSEKAEDIGRAQLKSLATHAGMPNPNNIGSPKALVGHKVGVSVVPEEYTDSNGETRMGSAVDRWHPFFDPAKGATGPDPVAETPKSEAAPAKSGGDPFDDDIPF